MFLIVEYHTRLASATSHRDETGQTHKANYKMACWFIPFLSFFFFLEVHPISFIIMTLLLQRVWECENLPYLASSDTLGELDRINTGLLQRGHVR